MQKVSRWLISALISLISMTLLVSVACKNNEELIMGNYVKEQTSAPLAIIPYILPEYYGCIEATPMDLENNYYTAYGNHAEAEGLFTGKMFVFKSLLVDKYMLRELDKGWIWVDLIKCPVINPKDAAKFKPGDRADVVGICSGRDVKISPGLYFKDCYILPAGCIQLPAPGGGGLLSSTY